MPDAKAPAMAPQAPLSKNAKRRAKRKMQKDEEPVRPAPPVREPARQEPEPIEAEVIEAPMDSAMAAEFAGVLERFQAPEGEEESREKGDVMYSDDDMDEEAPKVAFPLSRRRQRQMERMSVAELKQLVDKPELVEWGDVAAADPVLLLYLRTVRNSVPVPPHWGSKREYLQSLSLIHI